MKKSILHKELFTARDTNTNEYLEALTLNEQTLQTEWVVPTATAIGRAAVPVAKAGWQATKWTASKLAQFARKKPIITAVGTTAALNPDATKEIATNIIDTGKSVADSAETVTNLAATTADATAKTLEIVQNTTDKITDPSHWGSSAAKAGLSIAAGVALYKMFSNWLRKDERSRRRDR